MSFSVSVTTPTPIPGWKAYDADGDGKISTQELINAIRDWLNNKLNTRELIEVIQIWLRG